MRMAPYYINLRDTPGHNLCMAPNLTRYSSVYTPPQPAHTPRRHAPRAEQIECNARPSDSESPPRVGGLVESCGGARAIWPSPVSQERHRALVE